MNLRKTLDAHYKPQSTKCERCGHVSHQQWHKLGPPHIRGLVKLADAVNRLGRPADRYEAGIAKDGSEYGNFSAMRWWGLIESHEGKRWTITKKGIEFLAGRTGVPEKVLTDEGNYVGESIGLVRVKKLADSVTWERADYVANRLLKIPQLSLTL